MLREVKRGLCTYPGASSGSRGSRCPTGKISSGHCVHQWNLLPLTHLFPVLLGFCVIWSSLMYVQKHAGFKMENFVLKDNSWHASLSHIVRLSYSLFTLALIIPHWAVTSCDPHLGSLLAPSLCFFQLNSNPFGSRRVVWSGSTWQVGMCLIYLCFGVMRCSCLPAWLFLFSQLLWKPRPFRRTTHGDSRISFLSGNSNSSFTACHSSFRI